MVGSRKQRVCAVAGLVLAASPGAGHCDAVGRLTVSAVVESRCTLASPLNAVPKRPAVRCDGLYAYSAERGSRTWADRGLRDTPTMPAPRATVSKDAEILVISY